ncbi:MAG: DUF4336 domain-containing protein [Candidatus Binatia bacterium]
MYNKCGRQHTSDVLQFCGEIHDPCMHVGYVAYATILTNSQRQKNGAFTDSMLHEWAEDIWIAEAPLRFYGIPFGTRMTVLRLADGSLFLHSPIAIDDPLRVEIDKLGTVRYIVSPNKLHHLYLRSAHDTFPEAQLYSPPGLMEKRPDLPFQAELSDVGSQSWSRDLEQLVLRGSKTMQEVEFFHPRSRTLIVADMCEYFGPHSPLLTRIVARLARMYDRPRMPPDWQFTFRDRWTTRATFERLLAWDFDRVILAHGKLIESGAKALFRQEYAWAVSQGTV